ncbi:PIR Superfamily Protein [Plasmodium ovale curtisi]|uniref:PIR Superfamily Protein n=1 Tax=Plasmodium ovale curtisi TaxID=864141 RepID=A0A1A8W994_PLAOA|nr:PIR Superfamily Protein [Plasmodium ovale curtisi]
MSPQAKSTDFLGFFRNTTKELFSDKIYEAMNSDSQDLFKYNHECNKINVRNHKDKMIKVCEKFLRFLEKSTLWNEMNSGYDVSILLNYWIYERLAGYFDYYTKIETYHERCKHNLDTTELEDWENRKKLYDYYVHYDYLYKMTYTFHSNCEYYKKIEEKTSLFKHFDELCVTNENKCPKFYNQCQSYNPKSVLPLLPYDSKIKANKAATKRDSAVNHSPGHGKDPRAGGNGPGLQGIENGSHIRDSISETSKIGTKVGHSVLGIAPVLLTATALYRYTPVDSWVGKIGGYDSNSVSDIDEFSSYTQEPEDMFSNNSGNYISYQPI